MPCYKPIDAWLSPLYVHARTGKPKLMFKESEARRFSITQKLCVPCGQCIGCRLLRSQHWAVRCMHEASLHESNCFITLTFDDDHLDTNYSLVKRDFQTFMKRLRKRFVPKCPVSDDSLPATDNYFDNAIEEWHFHNSIRFFHVGEYGEQFERPHHHAILFNFDFPDKEFKTMRNGDPVFTSKALSELWPFGLHEIGSCTFESCAYVARYCTKKVNGLMAEEHYKVENMYGEIVKRLPEYNTMSRRPGIGLYWFHKYGVTDAFTHDCIVTPNGSKITPPRYYGNKYEIVNPNDMIRIKEKRVKRASDNPDNSKKRLAEREKVKLAQFGQLKRSLD